MSSPNGLYKLTLDGIKKRHEEAKLLPLARRGNTSRKRAMDKKLDDILVRQALDEREAGNFYSFWKNSIAETVYLVKEPQIDP